MPVSIIDQRSSETMIRESLVTSFIDSRSESPLESRTALIFNDRDRGVKVLNEIEEALKWCDSFSISVAFITMGGIVPLIPALTALEARGVRGRLLTTDYLRFTKPEALRKLLTFKNLDVRMYRTEEDSANGFHTKGYIFSSKELCRIIVGSSNLTQAALTTTREWNLNLLSRQTGEIAEVIQKEFDYLWSRPEAKPLANVIDAYAYEYKAVAEAQADARRLLIREEEKAKVTPNAMQAAFVKSLWDLKTQHHQDRALLISATGTGKTYASAFAAQKLAPKRLLFVVHREQIAKQAMKSFKRVLGDKNRTFGLLSGTNKESGCDFVFATMQTISREAVLQSFPKDAFDMIIIDEAHRAGAESYQKIMAHFAPQFWLGMTGTPERNDGFNIYALFNHNIAYEIRLQQALENDFLTPFHYFGIADLWVSNEAESGRCKIDDFRRLEDPERFAHMLEECDRYGYSGNKRRALVFVSTKREAEALAGYLNDHHRPAIALTGDDSQSAREDAVSRLVSGEGERLLEFIVTVDIFNEGVDIPEINQVILMRPTESAIIFIQQLGRGLRKFDGKEFVTILDFIGAYEKNYLIATALSGDRSYVKDTMRRFIAVESKRLPGASTVHFDEISKERIFASIDKAKTNSTELLRNAYRQLKFQLGRIPELQDFERFGSIEPTKFFTNANFGSYYEFLVKYEPEYAVRLTDAQTKRIAWVSRKLGNALRPSEALVLKDILDGKEKLEVRLEQRLQAEYGFEADERHLKSVGLVLANEFERTQGIKDQWAGAEVLSLAKEGGWQVAESFVKDLQDGAEFKAMLEELLDFILARAKRLAADRLPGTFLRLNAAYTYEDVCRLLDWGQNMPAQNIGGYCYDKTSDTLPIFVNYEKESDAIQYHDEFKSVSTILTLSKTNRSLESPDAQRMRKVKTAKADYSATAIHLFVRRNKDDQEAKAFYYLGQMDLAAPLKEVELPGAHGSSKAFEALWTLRHPVRLDIYEYLTGEKAK